MKSFHVPFYKEKPYMIAKCISIFAFLKSTVGTNLASKFDNDNYWEYLSGKEAKQWLKNNITDKDALNATFKIVNSKQFFYCRHVSTTFTGFGYYQEVMEAIEEEGSVPDCALVNIIDI